MGRISSIARRVRGRLSCSPAAGYDFDTLADDLEAVIEQFDLREVTLVGQSMGCGEIARYLSRRPTRIARAVMVSTITPMLLKAEDNPDGIDEAIFEGGRKQLAADRVQQIAKAAPDFFGVPHNTVSAEIMQWWTRIIVDQCSLRVMLDLHRAFTRADFRADLQKITVPVLLIHGDRDKSTLIDRTARRTVPLLANCELKIYENAAHGLPFTHAERLNDDIYALRRPGAAEPSLRKALRLQSPTGMRRRGVHSSQDAAFAAAVSRGPPSVTASSNEAQHILI